MSALTLLEQAKLITEPGVVDIHNVFATEFPINQLLPFTTHPGFSKPFTVVDTLPTVAPRDFGVDFTADFGKSSTYSVPWKNYGGSLQVDKALRKGNPSGAAQQELMQMQAIAKQWAADIFEGAGGTSITGIHSFLNSFFPGQIVSSGSTDGGDVLTMATMDSAFNLITLEGNEAIFCSQKVRDRLSYLARTNASGQQNIFWAPDSFGNKVMTYNGVPIYTMVDQYTHADILSVTELGGSGSTATASSLYIVKFGGDGGVSGFSPSDPTLGVETANPGTNAMITRLEMNVGVIVPVPGAVVQVNHIKNSVT